MKKTKISVIIPIYNMEKYLGECLDTVIEQTLKEIEIICVNDGSTDKSEEIILEYAKKDSRIVLISKENEGVGKARNDGINAAKGKYVAFMDPDDWYPNKGTLKAMYDKAEEFGVMICGGSFSEQVGDKLVTDFTGVKSKYKFKTDGTLKYSDYQFDYGYHRFIYNLDFLKKNNIVFPEYIRFQDPPFFIKAMIKAQIFYAMRRITYRYRVGTQKIVWTDKKLLHLLYGLRDGIRMSGENDLLVLHKTMLERIGKNYFDWYEERLDGMSCEMTLAILEICDAVNVPLLKKDEKSLEYLDKLIELGRKSYNINHQRWEEQKDSSLEKVQKYVDRKYAKLNAEERDKYELKEWNGECKVSVIIPIYNVEEYLEQCIQSVIDQTLKEIEIICVNDGTQDNSMEIVHRLAENDARITIVEKENGGLSSARNAGINKAKGKYILFLDSDDYLKADTLEKLWNIAWKKELDDVFFLAEAFYESEELSLKHKSYDKYYMRNKTYPGVWVGQDLFSEFMRNDDFKPSACLQFIRREILCENNIDFYEGIIHEDNLFTLQILALTKRVACVEDAFYMRRIRENSIMTLEKGLRNAYGYFITAWEITKFLEKNRDNCAEYYIDAVLQRANQYFNQASDFVRQLNYGEREEFLETLDIEERVLFRRTVFDDSILKRKNIEEKELIKKQDKIINCLIKKERAVRDSYSYRIGHKLVVPFGKFKKFIKKVIKKWKH